MRNQIKTERASQPTTQPLISQHTHEVIIKTTGSTVVIRCYDLAAAEREARWERRAGADVEVVEVTA